MPDKTPGRLPNFNAGPAAMPQAVLEVVQNDLLDYNGRGLSVLEMSHRSPDFADIAAKAQSDLRQLLAIPDDYAVLFMQGGATSQFELCVQNLDVNRQVAFADTGFWSRKAMAYAARTTEVKEAVRCIDTPLTRIPDSDEWARCEGSSYLHITDNETIDGIVFDAVPQSHLPLVCDMSSSILSQPVDVSRYAMIYAGAQKNIGPAGITVLIVRKDLIEISRSRSLPSVFSYAAMFDAGSMLNTPPTFAWYVAGLVFDWLLQQGGLAAMAKHNEQQAARVYAAIDQHESYVNSIHPNNRSRMNIPFQLGDELLTSTFLEGAARRGFVGLKGHKSVGGLRASLYNAVTDQAVDDLVDYLASFSQEHA